MTLAKSLPQGVNAPPVLFGNINLASPCEPLMDDPLIPAHAGIQGQKRRSEHDALGPRFPGCVKSRRVDVAGNRI